MAKEIYDVVETPLIAGFVVSVLSVAGFATVGLQFGSWSIGLDSTFQLAGRSVMLASAVAFLSYLAAGFVHEVWGQITNQSVDNVDRYLVAGYAAVIALVEFVQAVGNFVTGSMIGGVTYVLAGLAALYFVVYRF